VQIIPWILYVWTADVGGVLINWELRICFVLMYEVLMNELMDVEHM
jgi:hypothetical protein